jgi:ABC-2 type transport system ATP-binding protein
LEISLRNVTSTVSGRDSLRDFSADFKSGVTAVVGPEGSGKSALMAVLAGLVRPVSGDMFLNGESMGRPRGAYPWMLGYLPAKPDLPRGNTVEKTLLHSAAVRRLNRSYARERTEYVLSLLGLQGVREERISACTADVLKRVGIARAMLPDPEILLLEEPFSGLAQDEKMRFSSILAGLSRGRVAAFTSGFPCDAETGVDNLIFILEGRCLLSIPRNRLLSLFTGKVWRIVVPLDEAFQIKMDYVVTYQQKVYMGLQMVVVAEEPPGVALQALQEEPAIRDAYAYCMSKGVEKIDEWMRNTYHCPVSCPML